MAATKTKNFSIIIPDEFKSIFNDFIIASIDSKGNNFDEKYTELNDEFFATSTTPIAKSYDSEGAATYVVVVIIWYFLGVSYFFFFYSI
jgi:hypothetical protein